ncbi:MAG TPA: hypothetical protein VN541_14770 [Tepidisphaeraceae bacterium]|nr:hypothetical protein [Tepidisphaeraceae bacterium]
MHVKCRWNDWNLEHATKHGCTIEEIEAVLRDPGRGWPRKNGKGRYLVESLGTGGRMIQVGYVIDDDNTRYVIHAMPLTTRGRRGGR